MQSGDKNLLEWKKAMLYISTGGYDWCYALEIDHSNKLSPTMRRARVEDYIRRDICVDPKDGYFLVYNETKTT